MAKKEKRKRWRREREGGRENARVRVCEREEGERELSK